MVLAAVMLALLLGGLLLYAVWERRRVRAAAFEAALSELRESVEETVRALEPMARAVLRVSDALRQVLRMEQPTLWLRRSGRWAENVDVGERL